LPGTTPGRIVGVGRWQRSKGFAAPDKARSQRPRRRAAPVSRMSMMASAGFSADASRFASSAVAAMPTTLNPASVSLCSGRVRRGSRPRPTGSALPQSPSCQDLRDGRRGKRSAAGLPGRLHDCWLLEHGNRRMHRAPASRSMAKLPRNWRARPPTSIVRIESRPVVLDHDLEFVAPGQRTAVGNSKAPPLHSGPTAILPPRSLIDLNTSRMP